MLWALSQSPRLSAMTRSATGSSSTVSFLCPHLHSLFSGESSPSDLGRDTSSREFLCCRFDLDWLSLLSLVSTSHCSRTQMPSASPTPISSRYPFPPSSSCSRSSKQGGNYFYLHFPRTALCPILTSLYFQFFIFLRFRVPFSCLRSPTSPGSCSSPSSVSSCPAILCDPKAEPCSREDTAFWLTSLGTSSSAIPRGRGCSLSFGTHLLFSSRSLGMAWEFRAPSIHLETGLRFSFYHITEYVPGWVSIGVVWVVLLSGSSIKRFHHLFISC